jgi:hypothetical protein
VQRYVTGDFLTQFAARTRSKRDVAEQIEFLAYFIIFEVVEAAASFIKQSFDDGRVMLMCF